MELENNMANPVKLGWFRHYILMQDISPYPKIRQMRWNFWITSCAIIVFMILQFIPSLFMQQYFADGSQLKVAVGKIHMVQIDSNKGRKYYNPVIYLNNKPIGLKSFWQCGNYSNAESKPEGMLVRVWYMDGAIYQMENFKTGDKFKKLCTIDNFIKISSVSRTQFIKMTCIIMTIIILFCLKFNKMIRKFGNVDFTPQNKPLYLKMAFMILRHIIYTFCVSLYFYGDLFSISNFMR